MRSVDIACGSYDLREPFRISRGVIDCLTVLTVELIEAGHRGRGECVPSAEKMTSRSEGIEIAKAARDQILKIGDDLSAGLSREELQERLPAGPARNAVDCALWDLEAKQKGTSVAALAGVASTPSFIETAYTISLAAPSVMFEEAERNAHRKLIKVKLGFGDDIAAIKAVREAAPNASIITDVNGAWSFNDLERISVVLADLGVELVEQPMLPETDKALSEYSGSIPLCADESCHQRSDLEKLEGRYHYINIKLDKTGGLTEALALAQEAKKRGFGLMVGCMAGTSLSMAPAAIIGGLCRYVDLDGPVLLKEDRVNGMRFDNGRLYAPSASFWG